MLFICCLRSFHHPSVWNSSPGRSGRTTLGKLTGEAKEFVHVRVHIPHGCGGTGIITSVRGQRVGGAGGVGVGGLQNRILPVTAMTSDLLVTL